MIALENSPQLNVSSRAETDLRVDRTDIGFHDTPEGTVRIEITVHNDGFHRSPPTPITLQSAPFGAFVPWRPLARLLVPAIEPGESRVVTTEVPRPRPTPLGDFNRVPPKKLLTAVASPQDAPAPQQPGNGVSAMLNFFRSKQTGPSGRQLAPDLLELVGRDQPHWAGNINVFVGTRAVERHRAKALRVYPGRPNLAMFIVGSPGKADAYTFELAGLAPDWKAVLHDATHNQSLAPNPHDTPIHETKWVESNGGMMMVMLATRPPVDCQTGNLEVHVTRRSSSETAIVEFNLDPKAQGAGCYFA
jgi:hypothetical protein